MTISDRITAITNHLTDDWNSIDRLGLHTNILPKEYTQVDYIESNGTQYIDTNYTPTNNDILEFKNVTFNNGVLFSAGTDTNQLILLNLSGAKYFRYFSSVAANTGNEQLANANIKVDNGDIYYNNIKYASITYEGTVNTTLHIGNRADNTTYFVGKFGEILISNNGTLVRNFIPCYRNSDNEVGLYDLVNNVFYTNQGTGTFVYGQVQEQHIDKNIENIKEPLDLFYNEVSDKIDLSVNGVVGRTSQETTQGTNYFDASQIENPNIQVSNNGATILMPIVESGNGITTTSSTLSTLCPDLKVGDVVHLKGTTTSSTNTYIFMGSPASYLWNFDTSLTITQNHLDSTVNLYGNRFSGGETTQVTISDLRIVKNSTDSWEKFSYGASPNPDYPQPINNLSGNVPYKVSGKNLLDENYYNNSSLYTKSGGYFAFVELPDTFKTKFYVNMSVKGTNQNLVFGFIDTTSSVFTDGIRVLNNGTLNSNVECDFTNAEHVYIGIGNGSTIDTNTDIARIFDNYNIMVSTSSGEQYEPYIEPQTFNIPLKSKNLFDKNNITNGKYIKAEGTIGTDATAFFSNYIKIEPNINYYISGRTIWNSIGLYDSNKTFLERINLNYTSGIINITNNNCAYIKVNASIDNLNTMQLEEGNQSTDYELYYDIELCNIDTYEDKIYSSDGRFYLEKNIGKVVLDENSGIGGGTDLGSVYRFTLTGLNQFLFTNTTNTAYCNILSTIDTRFNADVESYYLAEGVLVFKINKSVIDSKTGTTIIEKCNNYLSNQNLLFVCRLTTSTTTEITSSNYPELYAALKEIQDYLTSYKINKEFILGYSSPTIDY